MPLVIFFPYWCSVKKAVDFRSDTYRMAGVVLQFHNACNIFVEGRDHRTTSWRTNGQSNTVFLSSQLLHDNTICVKIIDRLCV